MPGTSDEERYERSMRRIERWIGVVAVAGAVYAAVAHGWRNGVGFAAGAAFSWFSFRHWKGFVEALGTTARKRGSLWWIARLALIAILAYVIVKILNVKLVALLAGLLAAGAAAILEILYQLLFPGE